MTDPVLDQVCQIASDIFNLPLKAVTPQSSADTIENWDSLQHVNLVLALEQTFDLQFQPEEVAAMLNIGLIASLIGKKLGERQLA
ncbi:MAG TPA: acyl carrier protein [Candidatus Binatia bacterium]|jgi:acyl carrier protein|nr:acyl carrier protein [Candidatus Binatia bacterium]